MSILALVTYYAPGTLSGGPLRSVHNLATRLGGEFRFAVMCSDRDIDDTVPYAGITPGQWQRHEGTAVYYVAGGVRGLMGQLAELRRGTYHVLYVNSLFSVRFGILPLMLQRLGLLGTRLVLIAPRGIFSQGALAIRSHKKRLFLRCARRLGLFRDAYWQASSAHEAADIRQTLEIGDERIFVAPNPSAPLAPAAGPPPLEGRPLRVVFLSRIVPKKNLDAALDILSRVRTRVAFEIHGPEEDLTYAQQCREWVGALPEHVSVTWHGPIAHEHVSEVMAGADLFFLPTRGENFGHVIAEALAVGTPVLISDTTPWDGLAEAGAGAALPLSDLSSFVAWIDHFAALPEAERARVREAAVIYYRHRDEAGEDLAANRRMFRTLLERSVGDTTE